MGDMCRTFDVDNFSVQENGIVRDRDTGSFLFRLDDAARYAWQPIETYPINNPVSLLFFKQGSGCILIGCFNKDEQCWFEGDCELVGEPNHWMPLPRRPAGA